MCLALYTSISSTSNNISLFPKYEFLQLYKLSEAMDNNNILEYFNNNPVWLVVTDEGCSCGFNICEPPDEDLPEDIRESAQEAHILDIKRVKALYNFCLHLAEIASDKKVSLLGLWEGQIVNPTAEVERDIEEFFNAGNFIIKEQILYKLVKKNKECI